MNSKSLGFTLIELMVVVALIGVLAAIAIPNFNKHILRTKSSEAAMNIQAIRTCEISYAGIRDVYLAAEESPPAPLSSTRRLWNDVSGNFTSIGFKPDGEVYFGYKVTTSSGSNTFTSGAVGDIDGDAVHQCWAFQKKVGTLVADAPFPSRCPEIYYSDEIHRVSSEGIF